MSDVTQAERAVAPQPKPSTPSPSTPGKTAAPSGEGFRAQTRALTPPENLEDFGPVRTRISKAELGPEAGGAPTGRVTLERGAEDLEGLGKRVATAEIARSGSDGLSAKVGRKQVIEQDELRLADEQSLSYGKGQGTLSASSEARHRDEAGVLRERRVAGELGHGKEGAAVGVESHRKVETADKKTAASGKARWSKADGVEVAGALSREIDRDGKGRKIDVSASHKKDETRVALGRQETLKAPDGATVKSERSLELGHGKEGFDVKAGAARERSTSYKGQTVVLADKGTLVVGNGKAELGGSTKTSVVDTDEKTAESRELSGALRGGLDGGFGADVAYRRERKDEVSAVGHGAKVGYDREKGVTAALDRERTLGDKDGDHLTTKTGASYSDGNLTLSRGETARVSGDEGKSTSSSGQKLVVGKDGVSLGHEQKRTVVDADGAERTKAVGVTGDLTKGQLGVEASSVSKDKDRQTVSALRGSGSVEVGKNGLEKVSGEAAYSRGKTTIAVNGAYSFVVSEPEPIEQAGKRVWRMTVTKAWSKGASLTVRGVGGGRSESATESMTIVRDTRDELLAMRTAGRLEAELKRPTDARTVSRMGDGEKRSSSSGSSNKVSGEIGLAELKVGFQFQNGKSRTVTVTKRSGSLVQVQYVETETSGVGGSVGLMAGGFGGGQSRESSLMLTLEFDIESAEGLRAYESFRATGLRPKSGAHLVSTRSVTETMAETTASALGTSFADRSSVSKAVTHDGQHLIEEDAGQRAQSVSVPVLGSHHKSVGFELIEKNDKERAYRATASVTSSRASDAAEAIADATGTHTNRQASGEGSGTWNLSAEFSESQIDNLIRLIRHDKVVYAELFRQYREGDVLRRAVVAAGDDHDKIREALATFISKTGARGMAVIRKALDAKPSYDVELVGDKYLTGVKVRLEIEQKRQAFEARATAGGDPSALLADLDEAIAFHRSRAVAIESHTNYPELSHQLRATEVGRSREAVLTFGALRRRVAESARATRSHAESDAAVPASAEQSFVEPSDAMSIAPSQSAECQKPPPEVVARTEAWRGVGVARKDLEERALPEMERAFAEARRRHWIHNGAHSSVEPRSKLGFENFLGSGKHAGDYEQAEARLDFGKFQLGTLRSMKNALLAELEAAERANLGASPPPAEVITALTQRLEAMTRSFAKVTEVFRRATAIYRRIEAANPTLRRWEIGEEMPDGYHR